MIAAMKKELFYRNEELTSQKISSLYFGGGTPSILTVKEIRSLIDEVKYYFEFEKDIEITLEANPDDLNHQFLKGLQNSEINRLSIGTQSFFDQELKLMNRAHSAKVAETSIKRAQDFGFENISIDLIYGTPGSNIEIWEKNLQKTIDLQVPHISSYALTVEPKTAFNTWIATKKITEPDEHFQKKSYDFMSDFLRENHFQHYEISNFAKENHLAKHNSSYWKNREYLGIGPSAHSFNGSDKRSFNIANNNLYIKRIQQGIEFNYLEPLSDFNRINEQLMIGLRTFWGVDLVDFQKKFRSIEWQKWQKPLNEKLEQGLLIIEGHQLKIPEKYWFFADGIIADLFVTN